MSKKQTSLSTFFGSKPDSSVPTKQPSKRARDDDEAASLALAKKLQRQDRYEEEAAMCARATKKGRSQKVSKPAVRTSSANNTVSAPKPATQSFVTAKLTPLEKQAPKLLFGPTLPINDSLLPIRTRWQA